MANYYTFDIPIDGVIKAVFEDETGVPLKEDSVRLTVCYNDTADGVYHYLTFNNHPIIRNKAITLYDYKITKDSLKELEIWEDG